jgi:hypothetical protein
MRSSRLRQIAVAHGVIFAVLVTTWTQVKRLSDLPESTNVCGSDGVVIQPVATGTPFPAWPIDTPAGGVCVRLASGSGVRLPGNTQSAMISVESGVVTGRFTRWVVIGQPARKRLFGTEKGQTRTAKADEDVEIKEGESVFGPFGAGGTLPNDGDEEAILA